MHLLTIYMIKNIVALAFVLLLSAQLKAQDILLTLTGKEVPCVVNKVDTFFVFYQPLGKLDFVEKSFVSKITPTKLLMKDGTEKNVVFDRAANDFNGPYIFFREMGKVEKRKDRYNYFSCTLNSFDTLLPAQDSIKLTSREQILYAQDSLHKKFQLTVEEQRAYTYGRRSAIRNFKSPWSTLGGVATGFAGGVILPFFYGAGPGVVYVAINGAIRPPVGPTSPEDQPYLQNEYFIEGYRNQARLIKVKNSVLGAVPSIGVGILVRYFGTVY